MDSKVFVVQENNRLDYGPAEEFGQVLFITAEEYHPLKNSLRNAAILDRVDLAMESFDPDKDFLILTGNPVLIGYVFHKALQRARTIRFLQWDRMLSGYRVVIFDDSEPRTAL